MPMCDYRELHTNDTSVTYAADRLRVLFLCHYYPPEIGGGATRFHWMTRWLAAFGHDVTVVTGMPNYLKGEFYEGYRGKLRSREVKDGVTIERGWVYPALYGSRLGRLLNYFSFVMSSVIATLISWKKYDVMIAASPPLTVGAAGWLITRLHRIPWVFDIGDLWPDVAVEAGELSSTGLLTRLAYRLAKLLYGDASHLTPVTQLKRARLVERGVPPEKITVVENAVDLQRIRIKHDLDWRSRLHLGNRFIVVYAGLIGIAQGVEAIVDVAALLKTRPDIQFLIVGDGVRREPIVRSAQQQGLNNLHFLPSQPREMVPSILYSADAAWVPLVNAQLVDAVPSKLIEAWACRRPVILSASGEAASLVEASGGGLVTSPGAPAEIAEAVLSLASNPQQATQYGELGYKFVEEYFNSEVLARRMETILLQLSAVPCVQE